MISIHPRSTTTYIRADLRLQLRNISQPSLHPLDFSYLGQVLHAVSFFLIKSLFVFVCLHILMSTPRGYTTFPTSADLFYFCTTSSTSEEDLNLHYAPPSKSSLKIGVLVLGQDQVQLLDLA